MGAAMEIWKKNLFMRIVRPKVGTVLPVTWFWGGISPYKAADLNSEISGKKAPAGSLLLPGATGNRSPLHIPYAAKKAAVIQVF